MSDTRAIMRRDRWSIFKNPVFRTGLASVIGTVVALALAASVVFATATTTATFFCVDKSNNLTYQSDNGIDPYWYAQIATSNTSGPVYQTQGAKSNLSTEGNPKTWDSSTQHVNVFLSSAEKQAISTDPPNAHCHNPNLAQGCHVQVGWLTGSVGQCGGGYLNTGTAVDVYVEIFDDSSSDGTHYTSTSGYCLVTTFGAAPTNASYDARYYSTLSNGLHRYQVYYEVPGSGNIQNLAYGDFNDQYTYESAGGEIWAEGTSLNNPPCPVLGDTPNGHWDWVGEPATNTFASNLQLYTGSWVSWTDAFPGWNTTDPPYQFQYYNGPSDYSRFSLGGPHA